MANQSRNYSDGVRYSGSNGSVATNRGFAFASDASSVVSRYSKRIASAATSRRRRMTNTVSTNSSLSSVSTGTSLFSSRRQPTTPRQSSTTGKKKKKRQSNGLRPKPVRQLHHHHHQQEQLVSSDYRHAVSLDRVERDLIKSFGISDEEAREQAALSRRVLGPKTQHPDRIYRHAAREINRKLDLNLPIFGATTPFTLTERKTQPSDECTMCVIL